jgi:hypothetical protein
VRSTPAPRCPCADRRVCHAGLRISEAVAPTESELDLSPGVAVVHSEACRQSSRVLSAESEFSPPGSTRWADITRVTSVQPARSATLSSCATLTYGTTRGRSTIPRRRRTKSSAAWASRNGLLLRSHVRPFLVALRVPPDTKCPGFRKLRSYPVTLVGGKWDRARAKATC